jgi:hypothetical protein
MYLNEKDSLSQEELEKISNRRKGKPIPITPEDLKQEALIDLREALKYFIERQKLVAKAMTEMGLDLDEVAEYGALAWASPDEKSKENYEKFAQSESIWHRKVYQVAKRASERKLPQRGIWRDSEQNEWEYSLHGGGCQLRNIETGEPIDWDAPNVNSYTLMFFERHLLWQMSYPYRSIKLGYLRLVMLQSVNLLMKEIQGDNFSI